jgi:hypothetical protein
MSINGNTISGTFVYANIQEPKQKYQSDEQEYSIGVVVDKATAKQWNKTYQKQKAKAVDTSDFEAHYKIEPVFPDEDEQFIINLKKATKYKDGKDAPKPQVLLKTGNKAVNLEALVANGSKGRVSFTEVDNDYGRFAKLKAVLVEELIEYKRAGANAASDFGLEAGEGSVGASTSDQEDAEDDFADQPKPTPGKAVKTPTKPSKVVPALDEDDDSEMSPF